MDLMWMSLEALVKRDSLSMRLNLISNLLILSFNWLTNSSLETGRVTNWSLVAVAQRTFSDLNLDYTITAFPTFTVNLLISVPPTFCEMYLHVAAPTIL